ncbi:hypothetical protein [Lacticaseibacillus hulanensis]|jgi:hypothetical protein|uniref:hypothetical protein n=1 Tax=Lacticaseibacillus hulanensis TaxID=2493111 RepID=UPI000FDB39EF|nr:hypothetical protein [Lacticaseibacillus hulanensis]
MAKDAKREQLMENMAQWVKEFQGNVSYIVLHAQDEKRKNMVPEMVMDITSAMWDHFGREPRRWTATMMKRVLKSLFPRWMDKYELAAFDLSDSLTDFLIFMEDEHHISNARRLINAVDDASVVANDEYGDYTDTDEIMNYVESPAKPASEADFGEHMSQLIAMIATARHIDIPVGEAETWAFLQKYKADVIMLADTMTLKEAINLAMPEDEKNPTKFAHEFYTQYILPDIDVDSLLKDTGMPQLRSSDSGDRIAGNDVILMMVEQSLLGDPTPLNQNQRTMLASRVDGDPLNNPAAERRFLERHAAILQQYFGAPASSVSPHNQEGKIIDFAEAKRRAEAGENK